jgi:dihydroflavonol-4-reductase
VKTLVTGATGFIGSHLVEQLVREGKEVRAFVRKTSNTNWLKGLPVEIFVGDFFHPESLKAALHDVDFIFHVAGITKARHKRDYWRSNAEATRKFLEAVDRFGSSIARFVHISSQAAVGPSLNGIPVDERTPFHPIDVYGRSKRMAEEACHEHFDKFPITILRPVAVFGPRDKDTFAFFQCMNKGLLPIIGSEKKRVALIHVKDLVEGTLLAARANNAIGQTYFIGNSISPSWNDLYSVASEVTGRKVRRIALPNFSVHFVAAGAELLSLITGKPALISFEKAREIAQPDWSCNVEKAERELGYRSRKTLLDGMRETMEWYKKEGWLN